MVNMNARDLFNTSIEQIWTIPEGLYSVTYEDGVTMEVHQQAIVFDRFFWEMFTLYPNTPITSKCTSVSVIGNDYFNKSTVIKTPEAIFQHICKHNNIRSYSDKDKLLEKSFWCTNLLYNNGIQNTLDYMTGIHAMDFIDIIDEPGIVEIHGRIENTPDSVDRAYKELNNWIKTTDSNNPLVWANRSGAVNISQFHQCVGPRGYVTDLDRCVFTKPLLNGFIYGMNTLYDSMTESRTAAKALNAAGQSIQRSEYVSRRFQLSGMSVEGVFTGDCGSNQYLDVFMSKTYLKNFKGKWYLDEESNELKVIDGSEDHLLDKLIKVRTSFGCIHPDPHKICTTCLGMVSENFKENSNLGYIMAADFMQKITQKILSFKHEVKSVSGGDVDLTGGAKKFFNSNDASMIFINKNINLKNLVMILPCKGLYKLMDALVAPDTDIPMNKIGDIEVVALKSVDGKVKESVTIAGDDRQANITKELLEYIRENHYEIDQKGNYMVPLKEWNNEEPLFEIPMKEADVITFVSKVEELVEGTIKKKMPFKEHFFKLIDIVMEHTSCNISILEVMAYSASTFNAKEGNHRMGRLSPDMQYGTKIDIFRNRSMSQLMVFEKQMMAILKQPETIFSNKYRQRHPMDALFMPQEVIVGKK